ncbi:MAG: hypothetical protein Q4D57_00745 [Clostridia bacterium]|nr:hypothetical protein [Clostridia bacterium]
MSLLSKLKDAFGGGFSGASSSPKDYGRNFDVKINIGSKEIKNDKAVAITGIMVDSGMPPEAGVCEVHMKVLAYSLTANDELKINDDFAQIKIAQPLKIEVSNSGSKGITKEYSTIFTGFVERIESEIESSGAVNFVVHGMDAKMWMMANKLTESRGIGKSYEQVIKSVIKNYSSQGKTGKISLLKNIQLKSTFYQVDQSDYEFLSMMSDLTGSLFYVDPDGKFNFCAPSKLMKPMNTIALKNEVVLGIKFSASVWGTPQSVKVTSIDPSNPSRVISATSNSASSIGSGKSPKQVVPQNCSSLSSGIRCVNITDNSVENKEQAQARADAEYNRRNLKFVETELLIEGNPKICTGQGVNLEGFGAPFNNEYLVARVVHLCGTFSDDSFYVTKLYMAANKFTPQRG